MSDSETSSTPEDAPQEQPDLRDLDLARMAERSTEDLGRLLLACAEGQAADMAAGFRWLLRAIVATAALYTKVRLPRSHPEHLPSTDWRALVKATAGIGGTQAAALVKRHLASRWTIQEILERVAKLERKAAERHRPPEYPKLGTLLRWFPDPDAPERQQRPARVGLLESRIEELLATVERKDIEAADQRRLEHLLLMTIVAQQVEIERLRGHDVRDDTRPRAREGLDWKVVEDAWEAEMRRRGM